MTQPDSRILIPPSIRWINPSALAVLAGLIFASTPWMIVLMDRWMVDLMTGMDGLLLWSMERITDLGLGYIYLIIFITSTLILMGVRWGISKKQKAPTKTMHVITALIHRFMTNIVALILVMPFVYVLKVSIGRVRPGRYVNEGVYLFDPFHRTDLGGAMPSGHSADIAALCASMMFWALFIPNRPNWRMAVWIWTCSWLGLMLLVAFSRIALQWHFPSDTTFGLWIGLAAATVAARLMRHRLKNDMSQLFSN